LTRVLVAIAFALTACASPQSGVGGVFTVAVAGQEVLVGRSDARSGTFVVQSLSESPIECKGEFRYLMPPTGRAAFDCSNGEHGTLTIHTQGNNIGFGEGASSVGPVRILFGYSLKEVNRQLMPPGKVLEFQNGSVVLVKVESSQ
jgi:hypothetical protein